jgi:hypothetical protein
MAAHMLFPMISLALRIWGLESHSPVIDISIRALLHMERTETVLFARDHQLRYYFWLGHIAAHHLDCAGLRWPILLYVRYTPQPLA